MNRDQRKAIEKNRRNPLALVNQLGVLVDAKATSTSGRWITFLGVHSVEGLPCFDVLNIREVDSHCDRHHFSPFNYTLATYDDCRDQAAAEARAFFESTKFQLQQPEKAQEADEKTNATIYGPEGSEEPTQIN